MNRSIFRFTLNMHNHRSQASISAFRGDTGISLYITLTDGGVPFHISDGCTAILSGTKADGNPLWNRCVIENNNVIRYDFTEQTATCPGVVNCEITLYGPEGQIITAPKFIIVVDEREINFDEIPESAIELDAIAEVLQSEKDRKVAETERKARESMRILDDIDRGIRIDEFTSQVEAAIKEHNAQVGTAIQEHNAEVEAAIKDHNDRTDESIRGFDERLELLENTGLLDSQGDYLSKNYVPRMQRIDSAEQEEDGEYGYDFGQKYDRVYIERSKGRGIYNKIALSPTPSKIYDPDRKDYYVFDENGEIKKDEEGKPILSGKTMSSIPTRLDNGHILVPEQPGAYDWLYDGSDKYKKNYAVSKGLLDSLLEKKADSTSLDGKVGRIESLDYDRLYAEQSKNRGVVGLKLTYYAKNDVANIPQRLADGTMQCLVTDALVEEKEKANLNHGGYLVANVAYVKQKIGEAIAKLVDTAPETLNTLNELADALGDDPDFATTVATNIGNNAAAISTVEGEIAEIKSMVEEMNYVPVSIKSFTTDIPTDLEVGQVINATTLSWAIEGEVASLSLSGTGISGKITNVDLRSYTVEGLNINVGSGGSWMLTVTGKNGETDTKNISTPEFKRAIYWGISDSESLDASDIKVALVSKPAKSCEHSFTPECNNQYIYYCSPTYFGEANFRSGYFEGGFEKVDSVSLTNSYGYTQVYYVYRSTEKLNGSITITVT